MSKVPNAEINHMLHRQKICEIYSNLTDFLIEVTGFEPTAFWSRTKRATKLRYAPNGANEGTRTLDPRITNALLYQLSHIGLHK